MALSRYIPAVALAAIVGASACGNGTEPILIAVPDETREAELVDVSAGAIADPSAFDVITGEPVRTDQFSGWDFLFEIAEGDATVLWPRAAIVEQDLDAGLRKASVTFEQVREAPEEGYTNLEAVPVAVGDVFIMRSRRDPAFGNVRCRRHGKLEVLAIDMAEGTVSFRHLVNPNCEKRTLVPGAEE